MKLFRLFSFFALSVSALAADATTTVNKRSWGTVLSTQTQSCTIHFIVPASLPSGSYRLCDGPNWSGNWIGLTHTLGTANEGTYVLTAGTATAGTQSFSLYSMRDGANAVGVGSASTETIITINDGGTWPPTSSTTTHKYFYANNMQPNKARLDVDIASDGKQAHSVTVKKNGTQIASRSMAAGNASTAHIGDEVDVAVGDVFTVFVDGVEVDRFTAGSSNFNVGTEMTGTIYNAPSQDINLEGTSPTETPTGGTATGTQSNLGETSTTITTPNGTETVTTVNNANTTISGTSNGATVQDIYGAVKRGVKDAMNEGTPSNVGDPEHETLPDQSGYQAKADELTGAIDNAVGSFDLAMATLGNLPTAWQASFDALKNGTRLPMVSAGTWNFKIPLTVHNTTFDVDLSPYSPVLLWLRRVMSMIIAVGFFTINYRLVRTAFQVFGG